MVWVFKVDDVGSWFVVGMSSYINVEFNIVFEGFILRRYLGVIGLCYMFVGIIVLVNGE